MNRILPRLAALLLFAVVASPGESAPAAAKSVDVAWLPTPLSPAERDSLVRMYMADRKETDELMRTSPTSSLGAFARVDFKPETPWLVVGSGSGCALVLDDPSVRAQHVRVRVDGVGFRVEALDPGATFIAYGAGGRDTIEATLAPSWIGVGRFRVRLSYQNAPALIAADPDLPAKAAFPGKAWWPPALGYRYLVALEPDAGRDTVRIESTSGPPRPSIRVGWFNFVAGGKKQRLAAVRLLEPGIGENDISVFFRDGTSGKGSYGMGRYVDPERQADGRWILDFNQAYNPACAVSPYYNCPIPPAENHLTARILAGEAYRDPDAKDPAADHAGHGAPGHHH